MKGHITISRIQSSYPNDKQVRITIDDNRSRTRFLTISMNNADLADAVMGLGYVDCDFELHAQYVGKMQECKEELVAVSCPTPSGEELTQKLKEYEVDGWMGNRSDFENHHHHVRRSNQHYYRISFVRYVE